MHQNGRRRLWPQLAVVLLLAAATAVHGYELVSEYSINVDENEKVMGSMQGNFLVYNRGFMALYNPMGKQAFSRKLKSTIKPVLSDNGKYLGLVTYSDKGVSDMKTLQLEMVDPMGKTIWKLANPPANSFVLADNGLIFGIEGVVGMSTTRIHMYDQNGDRMAIIPAPNFSALAIAPSGKKFLVDRGRDGLDVYDSLGALIINLPLATNYTFDSDDRYLATFFNGVFHLFQDEKEVSTIKAAGLVIEDMAINVAANIVVLMSVKQLEIFELTTGKLLWDFALTEEEKSFTSLDMSGDAARFTCGVDVNLGTPVVREKRHVEGYLYLFDTKGRTMTQRKETYTRWGVGLPRGVFSSSGGAIMLETREKIEKLRIK